MQTPTISVIVPVYKAQDVLPRCIDSILAQTFHDFELLLIDDGSPDNSGEICDKYAAQDTRIRVFHQKNAGVSSARNCGLDYAVAPLVAFVDSDDYLAPAYFENLCSHTAHMVVTGYEGFGGMKDMTEYQYNIYDKEQIGTFVVNHIKDCPVRSPWCKLYQRAVIESQHLRFDSSMHIGEDTLFVIRYLKACQTIITVPGCDYHYFVLPPTPRGKEPKYSLNSEQYIHTVRAFHQHLSELGKCHGNDLNSVIYSFNAFFLSLYFTHIKHRPFGLKAYRDMRHTLLMCPVTVINSRKIHELYIRLARKHLFVCLYVLMHTLEPLIDIKNSIIDVRKTM